MPRLTSSRRALWRSALRGPSPRALAVFSSCLISRTYPGALGICVLLHQRVAVLLHFLLGERLDFELAVFTLQCGRLGLFVVLENLVFQLRPFNGLEVYLCLCHRASLEGRRTSR